MEYRLPQIFQRLYELSTQMIYKHGFSHQEIEFTFESEKAEDLYILQTRNQDMQTIKEYRVFSDKRDKMEFAGSGIGIGGGALNGILAFNEEDLLKYRQTFPEKALILVRPDTVPDDIGMIFKCDGLITGRGGATSHAAVTAVRLGKVCIVNCRQLVVDEENKTCQINQKQMASGDEVAIDGHFGNIFIGNYPVHTEQVDYHG
jgi:pyruvate,orthophosphate dikinase